MKEIDIENWNRFNTYSWFKTFSNSTYSMTVKMDITKLIKRVKKSKTSFFIDFMYIVVKGLNSVEEMRTRLIDDKAIIFDDINPSFTVMTQSGTYENVRFKNCSDYQEFYQIAREQIETTKKHLTITKDIYNPDNCYNEYYITCVPWINFSDVTHPIPDNPSSQCIPRICWGKYTNNDEKYEISLNITVSHLFVDGFQLAKVFNNIQELLDKSDEILK